MQGYGHDKSNTRI